MTIGDPVSELESTELYSYLKDADPDYAKRAAKFVREVAPILATTIDSFPYYTRHDAHHGFRVTQRIARVLAPGALEAGTETALLPAEVLLLIAGAYAHDLGMTVFPDEDDKLINELGLDRGGAWKTNPVLQTFLRKNHSSRGGAFIFKHASRLGIPEHLRSPLDWIMRSHNMTIADLEYDLAAPFAIQERAVDIRQLAVVLCIADALEFSETRVVDGVLDKIIADPSDAARKSYLENSKHICIGDSVAIEDDGRILVSGSFDEPEVLALANQYFDEMDEWIRGYCDIDRKSAIRRLRVRGEPLTRNLDFHGGHFERLGVRLSKASVINLIASNAVWRNDPGLPIRELVQNAVEACRFRANHSGRAAAYEPKVIVKFDRTAKTITIEDNGCGMSERTVLDHFLTIGNSRAKQASYVGRAYDPIARFGIGFWSVFTIADEAIIETAPFEVLEIGQASDTQVQGFSFSVSLGALRDYTVFAKHQRPCGTRLTLKLKPDASVDEIFDAAQRQIVCAEIEVKFARGSDSFTFPRHVPDVTDEDIMGARISLMASTGIKTFKWRGVRDDTEVAMGFAYLDGAGRPTFLMNPEKSVSSELPIVPFGTTAACGFRVPIRPYRTCFELTRVGVLCANQTSPRGLEYSIDRNQLQSGPKHDEVCRNLTHLIHDGYREFLNSHGVLNAEALFHLNEESARHGGNVFDQYTGEELKQAEDWYPDLWSIRLYSVAQDRKLTTADVRYLNLTDLRKSEGTVLFVQNSYYVDVPGTAKQFHWGPEVLLPAVYEIAKKYPGQVYVAEATRELSMLFDADPDSTLTFHRIQVTPPIQLEVAVQQVSLARLEPAPDKHGILSEARGRWSGAVYRRKFIHPAGKAYALLGRHRVIVRRGSALESRLDELKSQGYPGKIAEIISKLDSDAQGHCPQDVADLVS